MKNSHTRAAAYMRTSRAAKVGADKDSERRQREAIAAYAESARFNIAAKDWFSDVDARGADPIEKRPGFNRLLEPIESSGVRVVIVEDASRFARDVVAQELGILLLIKRGVRVITASGDDLADTSDPLKRLLRQVAGIFGGLEKTGRAGRLQYARQRKPKGSGPPLSHEKR